MLNNKKTHATAQRRNVSTFEVSSRRCEKQKAEQGYAASAWVRVRKKIKERPGGINIGHFSNVQQKNSRNGAKAQRKHIRSFVASLRRCEKQKDCPGACPHAPEL